MEPRPDRRLAHALFIFVNRCRARGQWHDAIASKRVLPTVGLIVCYASSFYCLTFALNTLPIAVVYATWSGLGIFLITLFGYLVFDEALDWRAILGLFMIVAGVVLVNGYASHK